MTRGRIAAISTKGVKRVFQVDAAINPGNSGGPVFNRRAELVGLLTIKFSHPSGIVPEGIVFAVPISYATPLLANIPDFDFSTVGRTHKDAKGNGKDGALVNELAHTTVRIETALLLRRRRRFRLPGREPHGCSRPSRRRSRRMSTGPSPVARLHPAFNSPPSNKPSSNG